MYSEQSQAYGEKYSEQSQACEGKLNFSQFLLDIRIVRMRIRILFSLGAFFGGTNGPGIPKNTIDFAEIPLLKTFREDGAGKTSLCMLKMLF